MPDERPQTPEDLVEEPDGRFDEYNAVKGAGVLDSAANIVKNIREGDWNEVVAHTVALGLGGLGIALDPIGAILAAGVAWVMDHLEPLPTFLDQIAGDPSAVGAFHATWTNITEEINALAADLRGHLDADLAGMDSSAVDAYRVRITERSVELAGCGKLCEGVAEATKQAAITIDTVRSIVRDLIAAAVAFIIQAAFLAVTIILIPLAIGMIAGKVVATAANVTSWLSKLPASMTALQMLIATLKATAEIVATNALTGIAAGYGDEL